ncbi:hypothetical protein IW140_006396 [Coemansia sp. RSA 1813]|nr:hypothetical protein EV178_006381 [Coemansia sp. RSA 1646]KAJ1765664.1 hypothetical protein LPJ74_006262 [Coemansia sp. RSA 1843]KAJ2210327.1 hypothetical protein EV179_006319 [Coemansia sp. RSA 487]KAJ2562552.1 hypothetical protein IW140_006396 [Coemansia sp. RSA 1813]
MTVDKREVAVIGVNTTIIAISLAALVYVNMKRSYVPLKCKNIPLLNTLFCAMFVWYIGDIYTYQPSVVKASRLTCIVTMSWLRMSLGVYMVVSCHIFRIYQYHCIFRWRVRATGKYLWIPVAVWAVIPLTYGILASALPAQGGGNDYIGGAEPMCVSYKPLYFVAVGFLVLLLVTWMYATLKMHGINVCFDEYRELLVVIGSTVVVVALQVVLRWVPGVGDVGFAYNTMASMTDILIGQVSLFVLIAKPAFHCMYDRDLYLKYFLHTLRREDRETEYELANGGQHMGRVSQSSYESDLLGSATDSTRSMVAKVLIAGHKDDLSFEGLPTYHSSETAPVSPIRLLV